MPRLVAKAKPQCAAHCPPPPPGGVRSKTVQPVGTSVHSRLAATEPTTHLPTVPAWRTAMPADTRDEQCPARIPGPRAPSRLRGSCPHHSPIDVVNCLPPTPKRVVVKCL
jgi:hypothetical protein